MTIGLGCMSAGLASIIASNLVTSMPLFLLGTVLAGVGQGLTLMGVLAAINLASPPDQRGEIISSLYVFNYLGLAVLVLGVGAASGVVGLLTATEGFAIVIGAVALLALILIRRVDPARHPDMPSHQALAASARLG